MEAIDQREIDQFDDWLDQMVLGHKAQPPDRLIGLVTTAVWLNSQRMTVRCSVQLERNIQAQIKAAHAGFFLLPRTLSPLDSTHLTNSTGNPRRIDPRNLAKFVAATIVVLPLLLFVAKQLNPVDDSQTIPAPSFSVGEISTPGTQDDALGLLLFPNLLVFNGETESSKITVWITGETLELTLANRSGDRVVFSLPSLDLMREIAPGSVIHLAMTDPPTSAVFEVRFPASPDHDYSGKLEIEPVTNTASPQMEVMFRF